MNRRAITVLGTLAAAFVLSITPASARAQDPDDGITHDDKGWFMYGRPCGSVYSLELVTTKAIAIKHNTGCQGHVWVRMHGDSWGDWHHDKNQVTLTSPRGKFDKALIKGCADCYEYTVYPKNR
ncbi:hypothetical protein AB0C98_28230 [Streptomyces sp. NPDC048558]|uniref:hypothetical protein n=1 Tax=Streptomyces sp. NPDC048558 TaxID=3155759 RepID=UPI00341BE823